jgi:hypothetical protein
MATALRGRETLFPMNTTTVSTYSHPGSPPAALAMPAGADNADKCVCRMEDASVGDGFDPNVAGLVHDGCAHNVPFARAG